VPQDSLSFISGLQQHGIKLGLDNIRVLCQALDHPERAFESIIVAGTNGKGSVSAMVDAALRADGVRTGMYTSPHLVDLTERFVIDGQAVTETALTLEADGLTSVIRALLASGRLGAPPTFFEATTALAFLLFRRAGIERAVLEVGMGGRFDATNVVDAAAAVITNVDLDHQQFLGQTLSAIAFEKAGVVKTGSLVVTGETKPVPLDVIRRVCDARQVPLFEALAETEAKVAMQDGRAELTMTTPVRTYERITLSLPGAHQVRNALVATRLLEQLGPRSVSADAIRRGLSDARWPGRLEWIRFDSRRHVVLDAAHNVAAATALNAYLETLYPGGLPMVFGTMRDKDASGMLAALRPSIRHLVCTAVENERAQSPDHLARLANRTCPEVPVSVVRSPTDALSSAWRHGPIVCAAGSIYLIGCLRHLAAEHGCLDDSVGQPPG